MKVSNNTQNLARDEIKKQNTKQAKEVPSTSKQTSNAQMTQSVDASAMKSKISAQNIKNINNDIGKLQVAQKSLKAIESDAKKVAQLSKDYKETQDKKRQESIKAEMSNLKNSIESTLKKATFDGSNVFSKNIKDNKEQVIFEAQKLNTGLLDSDAQRFYDVLKEQQAQIKDAIKILQSQAQDSADSLGTKVANSEDLKKTNGSFLKRFGSLFKVSHNEDKLNKQRVQELLK